MYDSTQPVNLKEKCNNRPFFFRLVLDTFRFVSSRLVCLLRHTLPLSPDSRFFQSSSSAAKQRDSRHMMATVFIINSSHDRPRRVY